MSNWRWTIFQGVQSPEGMKFPVFPWLSQTVLGVWGMLPQQILKIRMLRLAENEIHTRKFHDFSLNFSPCIEIPWHIQVFQIAGRHDSCPQLDFLPEKQKIGQNPDQTHHWYFNNLKSNHDQYNQSKLIRTTMPVSKDDYQY